MRVFMFPGQGSQSKGMGGALFDEFRELTERANRTLGYSIKELCLEDPGNELDKTQFTQPALYVVNALSYLKKVGDSGQKPDFLAGHSLGEFNALLAAECFDFETGLKLVKKRGELMSQATDGGMAAILNATKEEIETILAKNGLAGIGLANYNTPSQIVISGTRNEIDRAQAFFEQGKMRFYPLNTSGAFHSSYMQPSREKFESYLKEFKFSDLKIPVISNVTARPYKNDEIMRNLANQIASTVKWSESIQYLMGLTAGSTEPMEFSEIGHGDVLTRLVHTIRQQTPGPAAAAASRGNGQGKGANGGSDVTAGPAEIGVLQKKKMPKPICSEGLNETPTKSIAAEEKVTAWNRNYPVGTKVKSLAMIYEDLETRTEAVVLFGRRAAVYMKGYNGYFDLDEIAPL